VNLTAARIRTTSVWFLGAACLFFQGPLHAAPTTEVPTSSNTAPAAPVSALEAGARKHSGRGESSTIDMLVEMQQPSAGLQFNERQRAAEGQSRPVVPPLSLPQGLPAPGNNIGSPPARAEAPPVSAAGLFGTGATPQVQQPQPSARPVAPATGFGDGAAAPATRSVTSDPHSNPTLSRWLALPRELIEYVRENRGFVLGSVAAFLLAAWTGSLLVARLRG
jgi:hypothetical protein